MNNQDTVLDNDVLTTSHDVDEQKIISLNKFIFLCIISFGMYQIWWTYKTWRFFKQKEKSDIIPVARTIFSIFFLHSLFSRILDYAKAKNYSGSYSATALFIGYLVVSFLSRLPEPFWVVSILSFTFLIPPFNALNYAKQNSTDFVVTEETSFSTRQIILAIVGLIFWALVIVGLTMTPVVD